MDKLKPCPFCGGKAEVREYIAITGYVYVICRNCGVCAGPYGTEEKATKNWNRRVSKVRPVKRGKWIKSRRFAYTRYASVFTCSECNKSGRSNYNYCPNCGAKMDHYCPNCGAKMEDE